MFSVKKKSVEEIIKALEQLADSEGKEPATKKMRQRTRLILPPLEEPDLLSMPVTQLPERCWKKLN